MQNELIEHIHQVINAQFGRADPLVDLLDIRKAAQAAHQQHGLRRIAITAQGELAPLL